MSETSKLRGDQHRQEYVRMQAIAEHERGRSCSEIATSFGVTPRAVQKWVKAVAAGGKAVLARRQRGRDLMQGRCLTVEQEARLQVLIRDRCPDQLKLRFALWTRQAVRELIEQECGLQLGLSTVGLYLQRWGYTAQRPQRRAYEQDDRRVQRWLEVEYPKIARQAKREQAEIHWADETRCQNEPSLLRGYAPIGQTPTLALAANRKLSINLVSSITNRGTLRFMLYEGTMDSTRFITFLQRLLRDTPRKVYLIVDNLRVHHSLRVDQWVAKRPDRIALFHLPAYSPELNPDEYLNHSLKRSVHRRRMPRNQGELTDNARAFLTKLQRAPARVKAFFRHEKVRYAS
jgi:transposase